MKTPTSERSAKIQMTKLDKAVNDSHAREGVIVEQWNKRGVAPGEYEKTAEERNVRTALFAEMRKLSEYARTQGWHAGGKWLRYLDSEHD